MVPARVFGFSFLVAWFHLLFLHNPFYSTEWYSLFVFVSGMFAGCAFLYCLTRQKVVEVQGFHTALSLSLVFLALLTFIDQGFLLQGNSLAPAIDILLMFAEGGLFAAAFVAWVIFYSSWQVDNISLFLMLTVLIAGLLGYLPFLLTSLGYFMVLVAFPLLSFVFFCLSNKARRTNKGLIRILYRDDSGFRIAPLKSFLLLAAYALALGFVMGFDTDSRLLIDNVFSGMGCIAVGLVFASFVWSHTTRPLGMKIIDLAIVSCLCLGVGVVCFFPESTALAPVLFDVSFALLLLLGLVHAVGIAQTYRSGALHAILSLLTVTPLMFACGLGLNFLEEVMLPDSHVLALGICAALCATLLVMRAVFYVQDFSWVAPRPHPSRNVLAERFRDEDLRLGMRDIQKDLVAAYTEAALPADANGLDAVCEADVEADVEAIDEADVDVVGEVAGRTSGGEAGEANGGKVGEVASGAVGKAASGAVGEAASKRIAGNSLGAPPLETSPPIAKGLSKREREIFGYLARGRNVPWVSEKLCISQLTVKTHVQNIYKKLDIRSQQDLISLAEASWRCGRLQRHEPSEAVLGNCGGAPHQEVPAKTQWRDPSEACHD
ncbi:MAG: helix-turn-helix transcriptional regulator [Coriobacteriaceae bacterium]|jgi:DNA-binding CsgD family transcriptional regulator|nr:helix-turn-helix transcriptional regulator [Coriobacteriaceae bacterium]